jgi:hypothetical protein
MSGFELKTLRVSRYPTLHVLTGLGSRQVYALVADQWLLIRVEEDGQAISDPNSVFRCGPELRPESIEIVLQALNSSDPSEVLAMLCWLGGFTREVSNPRNKAASTAAFYSEALRNPFVSKRLEELKESQDRWTRDGAALVLKR